MQERKVRIVILRNPQNHLRSEVTSSAKKAEFMEVIAIYSCIHGKCNRWDSTTMTGDVRLFKV